MGGHRRDVLVLGLGRRRRRPTAEVWPADESGAARARSGARGCGRGQSRRAGVSATPPRRAEVMVRSAAASCSSSRLISADLPDRHRRHTGHTGCTSQSHRSHGSHRSVTDGQVNHTSHTGYSHRSQSQTSYIVTQVTQAKKIKNSTVPHRRYRSHRSQSPDTKQQIFPNSNKNDQE